ncbi:hypothetical protein DYQ86_04405 [Acidobacteria bacterium AB60]|nr:hypothetical protein DYQ86_04405 [Acidobacteria bacterium AB60]
MKSSTITDVRRTEDVLMNPINLGAVELRHRVIMAPLTRARATWPGLFPNDLMAIYYEQLASDGGLVMGRSPTFRNRRLDGTVPPAYLHTSRSKPGTGFSRESMQKAA